MKYVSEYNGDCFSIKEQNIHTVGNRKRVFVLVLDPQRGSLYVPNFSTRIYYLIDLAYQY